MTANFNHIQLGLGRIEVMTNKGTVLFCQPAMLDALLEKNLVTKFRRKSGWVTVGVDPIRIKSVPEASHVFNDFERRASH
jgi:hypothetical protein